MKTFIMICAAVMLTACTAPSPPTASTGVRKADATVSVQASGLTIEQENVQRRLEEDNKPGSIKHLYVISAYSGDVLLYSTVSGKVTSSGKRLTPYQVSSRGNYCDGFTINIGGSSVCTDEVLQDDGTYGSSEPYIYWWDSKAVYHQHYVQGGQIVHVSTQPMRVGKVIISTESQ